jgi:hypothetical protein
MKYKQPFKFIPCCSGCAKATYNLKMAQDGFSNMSFSGAQSIKSFAITIIVPFIFVLFTCIMKRTVSPLYCFWRRNGRNLI